MWSAVGLHTLPQECLFVEQQQQSRTKASSSPPTAPWRSKTEFAGAEVAGASSRQTGSSHWKPTVLPHADNMVSSAGIASLLECKWLCTCFHFFSVSDKFVYHYGYVPTIDKKEQTPVIILLGQVGTGISSLQYRLQIPQDEYFLLYI